MIHKIEITKKNPLNLKQLNNSDESKLFTLNYMINWCSYLIIKSWNSCFLFHLPSCSWAWKSGEGTQLEGRKEKDAGGKELKAKEAKLEEYFRKLIY